MRIAQQAKAAGYDLVKLYGMNGAELDSLAAAHRLGIRSPAMRRCETPCRVGGLEHALKVGYASLEHLTGFDTYLTDGGSWVSDSGQPQPFDETKLRTLVRGNEASQRLELPDAAPEREPGAGGAVARATLHR